MGDQARGIRRGQIAAAFIQVGDDALMWLFPTGRHSEQNRFGGLPSASRIARIYAIPGADIPALARARGKRMHRAQLDEYFRVLAFRTRD